MYKSGDYEIANSLRMNDADVPELLWPASSHSGGNRRTFTHSLWVKRGIISSTHQVIFEARDGDDGSSDNIKWEDGQLAVIYQDGTLGRLKSTALFRDSNAWYHIVVAVDTTQGTNTNRIKVYVNGVQLTSFTGTNTYMDQNADTRTSYASSDQQYGNARHPDNDHGLDGYLAEVNFVDGLQLTPASFAETDDDYGHWKPKKYEGAYGNEGYYLDFKSSGVGTAGTGTIGADRSGNTNHFTSTNVAVTDQMIDTPTNNFCVLSAVDLHTASSDSTTLSEGNLKLSADNGTHNLSLGTFSVSSGKWYWEFKADGSSVNNTDVGFVIDKNGTDFANDAQLGASGSGGYAFECETDKVRFNGTASSALSSGIDVGDVVGVALDMDNGKVWWSVNGTFVSSGNPAAGSNEQYSSISGRATPAFRVSNTYINDPVVNFGQDSSFAGFLTAQGNTDGAGNGDFYYTPPSGFLALCSKNLPAPAVTPSKNFNTVQYTGNASSGHAISGVGFKPDWVWMKERNAIGQHSIFDIVRGVEKRLGNGASGVGIVQETSPSGSLTSFDSDGFTVGNEAENNNNNNYVSWNWKGSNTTATNTDGSIDSTVSANVAAGFSIVGYAGDGGVDTIGHGLSAALEFLIVRNRTDGDVNWITWHHKITQTNHNVYLNATTAENNNAQYFFGDNTNMTVPSASVFTVGNNGQVNNSSKNYIAYCFHSVDGFSKFGSWKGNANDDAPFVFTGFKPMWVMWKKVTGSAGWFIHDTKRSPFNKSKLTLAPETNAAEQTSAGGATDMFFLSNGFKLGGAGGDMNGNNETYIYLAFAETPFKYANAH